MSSLVYLGFSIITFAISYGLLALLMPTILGYFFSIDTGPMDPEWQQTQENTEDVVEWLIPIIPSLGIVLFVIKVLMVASTRGRD